MPDGVKSPSIGIRSLLSEVGTPPTPEGRTHVYHLYNLYYRKPEENDLMILLLDKYGIRP